MRALPKNIPCCSVLQPEPMRRFQALDFCRAERLAAVTGCGAARFGRTLGSLILSASTMPPAHESKSHDTHVVYFPLGYWMGEKDDSAEPAMRDAYAAAKGR